jgi:putative photosynthetic complex assembly protein 2
VIADESRRDRWISALEALGLVVLFWWLVTGLLFGIPEHADGRRAAAIVASLLGGSALALAILIRQDRSPRAAWLGFLAGGTLWAWAQAALYGGWLVGPGSSGGPIPDSRWAVAIEALRETSWNEAAAVGVLLLTAVLAVGARNKVAFGTVALLWGAHQVARINVFLGVANASPDLLPDHLQFLTRFFGPPVNSPLLPVSVVFWVVVAGLLLRAGWRSPDRFSRRSVLIFGVLAGLAALEHLFLGLSSRLALWDFFLRSRSG